MGGLHLLAHLFQEFIEGLRRVVAEHIAELFHEIIEPRILARDLLHQHFVQRFQHVLHALDVAFGHVVDHVLDVFEERVGHRAAQLVQKFQELLLRLGI